MTINDKQNQPAKKEKTSNSTLTVDIEDSTKTEKYLFPCACSSLVKKGVTVGGQGT